MNDKLNQIIPFMPPYKEGYYPGMIYDIPRNLFYQDCLRECKDKICADVGFGTGLLTLIALHHGAKHVYAYENEPTTFEFGKEIIETLGLSSKVTFIKGKYQPLDEEIIFSEIVDRSIWGEGLKSVREIAKGKLLPATVSCNIRCDRLKDSYIKPTDGLADTGLPFNDAYNEAIEYLLSSNEYASYDDVGKNILNGDILNSYKIDLNKDSIPDRIEIDIDIPYDNAIIWCENFIDNFRLMDGHWRSDKIIHKFKKGKVKFIQSTENGSWWLE